MCGYRNVYKDNFSGNSGVHPAESNATVTTNGAGPHNVQLFILSADGVVLHCLPGYWDPHDLASELALAQKLNDVWTNKSMASEQKSAIYKKMQLDHLAGHSKETTERSHLQGFDAQHIAMHAKELPDLVEKPELLKDFQAHATAAPKGKEAEGMHVPCEAFKTTDVIMHERLSKMPFVAYSNFDVAKFTNYATEFYDKNETESEGSAFRPDLKKMDLHKVTHDAEGATPLAQCSSSGCSVTAGKTTDPAKLFMELASANRFSEAFVCASGIIKSKPNGPAGYEMRAISAYALAQYERAYEDATRAAWLGCRDASNAEVRRLAKWRLGQMAAQKQRPLRIAQK